MALRLLHKKPRNIALTLLGVAVLVFTIAYFQQEPSSAADLRNFDAGNIMSDAVMSNKGTMTEAQIQAFLDSKNACNNTNTYMAAWYPNLQYNIRDGKFVCMAKESFNGESAAHIIWQAGQDYNINPQVLIVLLQKEQGLITDTWPNHIQYRAATGFGCPDTDVCDSQYYGLKNQIRKSASLFRSVLDGGWSNYPVGNNYVQYNPNTACGGSVINIKNRATSALYRYTPYQPNQSALNAGYGTGDGCGAYGNRNFWAYFTDWFGSTQATSAEYSAMDKPRRLMLAEDAHKVNPITGQNILGQTIDKDTIVNFTSRTNILVDNSLCLRTEANTNTNWDMCVPYKHLEELPSFTTMLEPRKLVLNTTVHKIDPMTGENIPGQTINKGVIVKFSSRIDTLNDKELCLRTDTNTIAGWNMCVLYEYLDEYQLNPDFSGMDIPRYISTRAKTVKINPMTGEEMEDLPGDLRISFSQKTLYKGSLCLRTTIDTGLNKMTCVLYENLRE